MNAAQTPRAGLSLVGARATGKSSVGRLLAEALERPFADTDTVIVRLAGGLAISEIFARWGEPHFRDLEAQALGLVMREPGKVVATGGGAVLRDSNRALLKRYGWVVWLTADPAVLAGRLAADADALRHRPALTSAGPLRELAAVLETRAPFYRHVADAVIDTTARSIPETAALVRAAWLAAQPSGGQAP
jgi:shikimate kinase